MADLLVGTFSSVFVEGVPEYVAPHQIFDVSYEGYRNWRGGVRSVLRSLGVSSAMGTDDVH